MTTPEHRYEAPVEQLLALGESWIPPEEWPDYPDMGLGPDDVPELLRLATDHSVYGSTAEVFAWGPVHAWRALAQLGATEAIEPLLAFLRENDDDASSENIAYALAVMGAPALEPLARVLGDGGEDDRVRIDATVGLRSLAEQHPELRDAAVSALVAQLERFDRTPPDVNAFLILQFVELQDTSALALIERAFAARQVDESLLGDWEDVQVQLGLKKTREAPRPNYFREAMGKRSEELRRGQPEAPYVEGSPAARIPSPRKAARSKQRKKQEKQSRQKNRRR